MSSTRAYTYLRTLSLHDALPSSISYQPLGNASIVRFLLYSRSMICHALGEQYGSCLDGLGARIGDKSSIGAFDALDDSIGQFGTVANCMLTHTRQQIRSEEHTSELQSLMRISYAVFRLKKKIEHHR